MRRSFPFDITERGAPFSLNVLFRSHSSRKSWETNASDSSVYKKVFGVYLRRNPVKQADTHSKLSVEVKYRPCQKPGRILSAMPLTGPRQDVMILPLDISPILSPRAAKTPWKTASAGMTTNPWWKTRWIDCRSSPPQTSVQFKTHAAAWEPLIAGCGNRDKKTRGGRVHEAVPEFGWAR